MKIKPAVTPTILAFTLCLSCVQLACGQSKPNKTESSSSATPATAKTTPEAKALTKFSNDGKAFIESVRAARTAIFNGDPKTAKDLMSKAKTSLEAAKKDAPTYSVKTTTSVQGRVVGTEQASSTAALVPVDGQMVVADDYVLTPEKQTHINKANEHIKKGETKEALDEFRLADIDVGYNRLWVPIAASEKHLDDATKFANENKFYESNLALKAIEDGIKVDSVSLVEPTKAK